MPSTSAAQRSAAGLALAAKRGEIPLASLKGAARQMFKGMTQKQLREFASGPVKKSRKGKG
jgi:hypothetical protein